MAIQNMERDAPWTAWSKMPQLHKESALQGRVAQPKRTFGTKVPAYEDAAASYSTFNFQLSCLLPRHACRRNKAANTNMKSEKN
jgi:hypothetical protein